MGIVFKAVACDAQLKSFEIPTVTAYSFRRKTIASHENAIRLIESDASLPCDSRGNPHLLIRHDSSEVPALISANVRSKNGFNFLSIARG